MGTSLNPMKSKKTSHSGPLNPTKSHNDTIIPLLIQCYPPDVPRKHPPATDRDDLGMTLGGSRADVHVHDGGPETGDGNG